MDEKAKTKSDIFAKIIVYAKENLAIGYSIFLLILVPAVFFAYNYFINTVYGDIIDSLTRRKADLAENIFNGFVAGQNFDAASLQLLMNRVAGSNEEIVSLSILKPSQESGAFEIVASSDAEIIGQIRRDNIQDTLAWSQPEGIAFLDRDKVGRFWREIKLISGPKSEKIGLIEMSLSIADADAIANDAISKSYWILTIIILVLVLLLANQIRQIEFALNLNKLREVDKMKDIFISMASHELRAPLAAIKGYLDLLKDNKDLVLDQESSHYLENISASEERLARLVEDMLEVSRLEGNRFPLEISEFNPDPLIKQSVEEMRSQAMQKNLVLDYQPSPTPVLIKADPARVKQVAVNLIGNALKYTSKGSVRVNTAVKKDNFLITVADTGIGISSEDQKNLFEKFYRAKNEQTKNIIGTGLGLWITLETVKRMKGKITVESIEGVGSHFTVHLPLAKK